MSMISIQAELKVPKAQYNSFGQYYYRSCEDIVEAAKPILAKHNCYLVMVDDVVGVGDRVYIKATATVMSDKGVVASSTAFARESLTKKGMDDSQITGTASSYARKYALNGLFAIDDTKDADASENGDEKPQSMPKPQAEKQDSAPSGGQQKPWYNTLKDDKPSMVIAVRAGQYTAQDILNNLRAQFAVNKAVAEEILAIK